MKVNELKNAVNRIEISEKMQNEILQKVNSAGQGKEEKFMKPKKKIFIVAVAAMLVLGLTAFAASTIISSWYSSSSSIPDYKTLPSAEQCIKDIGYKPVLIETFKNGYVFKNGSVVSNNLENEDGKSVEKFKSVSFDYEKDGDIVVFSQNKFNAEAFDSVGDVISTVDDVDIYYYSYKNKNVPANYQMTDEDKKNEASGKLIFSWGSDEVKITDVQFVSLKKDGVLYQLMQIDGKLSAAELSDMAKEVIKG